MRHPKELAKEEAAMATLAELTDVFEGLASMRIAQIKSQVLQATQFFEQLWHIYSQLRVENHFRFGRGDTDIEIIDKELYIIITAEGGFSGDIDHKLIQYMLDSYDEASHDIIVIGHHGAIQLAQAGIACQKYFKLPAKDRNINVSPVIAYVQRYRSTTVFYQEYESLMVQDVKKIELSRAVQEIGENAKTDDTIISEINYIFEPSTYAVIDHLEGSMLRIAISQLILNSKLAQYASRFRAMSASHRKADEAKEELHLAYNRSKRAIKDARLKETVIGIKKARADL